jgi:myo-inositol 2-dehydrogenase/D-chiro-inositol 1-dehydrogenase
VSGGVIHQLGVHGIDLLLHLFGDIAQVSAAHAVLRPMRRLADGREVMVRNPDSAWATYRLANGAIASHEMSMIEAAGTDRFRLEIHGSEGALWLRTERGALAAYRSARGGWEAVPLADAPFGRRHHQHWIDGLAGRAPKAETAKDALRGMAVVEAILRSAARASSFQSVETICP